MNNELFNRARALYQARDYQGALSAFSQCLQDGALPVSYTHLDVYKRQSMRRRSWGA